MIVRRRLSAMVTAAAFGISSMVPAASETDDSSQGPEHAYGALGANFNQNLDSIDYGELELAGAEWVRGFYQMPETDDGDPSQHFAIENILEASERGHQTILTLSYPYDQTSFPEPGSPQMQQELDRLDEVLPLVVDDVDILVVGNEPFIQSQPEERDSRLNEFYEAIAEHIIDFRGAHCLQDCGTLLYMGALNRLDLEERRTPATARWMDFVHDTPELEGVNIHPHVPDPEASQDFLDYILPRMRDDQTFLVTEFSIVWLWQEHLEDPADAEFLDQYGFEPGAEVWEVVGAAIEDPFTEEQWSDFLRSSDWFMEHSDFLHHQMELFRDTERLAVATYGFRQDELMVEDFGPDKDPWLFNSVFAAYTVEPRKDTAAPGFWLDSFQEIQDYSRE